MLFVVFVVSEAVVVGTPPALAVPYAQTQVRRHSYYRVVNKSC
ncbi:hypothetical protein [Acrocarpospora macrocephala]|nr:hypothetical protein [Acrocarpospora macrocephala]